MQDHADVVIKPPILFTGAIVLGCLLSWLVPLGPELFSANRRALAAGGVFALIGLALFVVSVREFGRAGTSVVPGEPSTVLLDVGAYRFTRNPIYISFVIFYFGVDDFAARRGRARGGLSAIKIRRGLSQIPGPRSPLAVDQISSSSGLANWARSWMKWNRASGLLPMS